MVREDRVTRAPVHLGAEKADFVISFFSARALHCRRLGIRPGVARILGAEPYRLSSQEIIVG